MFLYRALVNAKNAAPKAAAEAKPRIPAAVLIVKPSVTETAAIREALINCPETQ